MINTHWLKQLADGTAVYLYKYFLSSLVLCHLVFYLAAPRKLFSSFLDFASRYFPEWSQLSYRETLGKKVANTYMKGCYVCLCIVASVHSIHYVFIFDKDFCIRSRNVSAFECSPIFLWQTKWFIRLIFLKKLVLDQWFVLNVQEVSYELHQEQ